MSNRQIQTVCKQFDKEYLQRNISYTLKQKNIKNLAGYFMKALELDYGQTLLVAQEQKVKNENVAKLQIQQEQEKQKQKKQAELLKKQKIQEFINSREEEVINLIPSFVEANSFILKNTKLDLEDQAEILAIIKGERKEYSHIKSLFMGFISHKV